jgi:homoserine kinase
MIDVAGDVATATANHGKGFDCPGPAASLQNDPVIGR